MIAYIDTSVVLRIVLQQPSPLAEWYDLNHGVSSALLGVECRRSLDRMWRQGFLSETEVTAKRAEAEAILQRLDQLALNHEVLETASDAIPTPLGTLDALHLASAVLYRRTQPDDERPIVMATHDKALAEAARAMRFDAIGWPA